MRRWRFNFSDVSSTIGQNPER